jgi:hypothetical protein
MCNLLGNLSCIHDRQTFSHIEASANKLLRMFVSNYTNLPSSLSFWPGLDTDPELAPIIPRYRLK